MNVIYFGPLLLPDEGRVTGPRAMWVLYGGGPGSSPPHGARRPREIDDDVAELSAIAATAVHTGTSGWFRSPDDLVLK